MKINFLKDLRNHVKKVLDDDEVKKDCTSKLLRNTNTTGEIIFKTSSIIYGIEWVDEVFKQVDPKLKLKWHSKNGKYVKKGVKVCTITGKCQSILSGERVALNFLQTLSGIANSIDQYKKKIKNTGINLLYTRKILPGWKYAIQKLCKSMKCHAHRDDLSSSILLKENHLKLIDNLEEILLEAKKKNKFVVIEVSNIREFKLVADNKNVDRILLDNFSIPHIKKILQITTKPIEISGNINLSNISKYALKGVNCISVGSLTKNVNCSDISLLIK